MRNVYVRASCMRACVRLKVARIPPPAKIPSHPRGKITAAPGLPEQKSQIQPESVLPATDHTIGSPLGALLLAGLIAVSVLPAPALSDEEALDDVPVSEGNDPRVEETVEQSEAANNSADPESNQDRLTSEVVPPEENFIERAARAFTESDLVFARSFSNAPFLPVAFLGGTHYGDATVSEEGATPDTAGQKYQVSSTSQYAGVPFLLSKRSMAVLGEYVSYADFSVENGEDFSVTSASIAAGYLYQVDPDWQVIAALVPFYNH